MSRAFIAVLLALASACAAPKPPAAPAADAGADGGGFVFSIKESTQGNFGALGIGVGYVGGGAYLDENAVRRDGLHASLSIAVRGNPAALRQPDVREGQVLEADGYRFRVEKLDPAQRGTVVLRLWRFPEESVKPWYRRWFD